MGLDMYAYVTAEPVTGWVDFPKPEAAEELHYWRKHPNLHGWMQQLYTSRGGTDADFNLASLRLNAADLEALERGVIAGTLPKTCGFFFGESDGSERDDDLDFIMKARKALRGGQTVIYIAWW